MKMKEPVPAPRPMSLGVQLRQSGCREPGRINEHYITFTSETFEMDRLLSINKQATSVGSQVET